MELAQDGARVGVSVLCPGPVHTNIGRSSRNRPPDLPHAGFTDVRLEDFRLERPGFNWVEPDEAGAVVVDAIKTGKLYALTHPDGLGDVERRHQQIVRAFEDAQREPE
jgi:hypothetical protein